MEEAHRHATRALAIVERTPPRAAGDLILFYLLAAETSPASEHRERDRLYGRARELCRAAGPQYTWGCVGVHDNQAAALRERGQCRRALPLYQQAIDLVRSIEGVEPSASATILAGRGLCLSQLGRHRSAVAEAERAHRLLAGDAPPADAAAIKHALGRVLAAAGRERVRAAELLRAARALYVEAGAGHDSDLREVDQALRDLAARR